MQIQGRNLPMQIAWRILAILILLFLPVLKYRELRWELSLRILAPRWTKERLDAFLRDPQAVAAGSTMAFAGVHDDVERAALVEHLESLINAPPRR